ncbi:MAG TPA: LacI family transcriptional regulator, partial [Saprospiraceae bacterium]|nr:LacI family transcriptional regulator [Saprospiraceae bacterium]
KELKNLNIPLIFFDRAPNFDDTQQIINDDRAGAFKAVTHLIEMGYRRIAHFAGPSHLKLYKERKQGYLDALKKHQIKLDKKLIIEPCLKLEEGKAAIQQLMNMTKRPDALFSASDYSALGALLFLKEKAVHIPKEFGVVGYSNENFTALISPALTTVDQHAIELGRLSAKSCLDILNNNKNTKAKSIVLDPQLIIRASSQRK